MKLSASASVNHENLSDELMLAQDKTIAVFEGVADIEVAEFALGWCFDVEQVFVVAVGVLLNNFGDSCSYIAESIENKNQFDTFGQYSCFTLA